MKPSQPHEVRSFRKFMIRLGFEGVSIKRMEQDPNLFAVCAFDRMNESVPFPVFTLWMIFAVLRMPVIFFGGI